MEKVIFALTMSSKAPKTTNGLLVLSKESKKLRAKAPLVNAWGAPTTTAAATTTAGVETSTTPPSNEAPVEATPVIENPTALVVEEHPKEELKSVAPAWDEYGGRGTTATSRRIFDTSTEGPTNLQQLEYAAREPTVNQSRKLFDPNTGTLVEFKHGNTKQNRGGRGNHSSRPARPRGGRTNHTTNRSGPPPNRSAGRSRNKLAERKVTVPPPAPAEPPAPVLEQPVDATEQDTIQLDLNALVNNTSMSNNHIFAFGSNSTWGTPATTDWGNNNSKPDEDWNKWMGS